MGWLDGAVVHSYVSVVSGGMETQQCVSRSRNGGEHSSSPFRERNVTEQQTLNWKGRLSHDPLLEESLNEKESPYSRSAMPGGRGMTAEYWFLLPVGCTIAVLAMSSGVSAGNFWVPVYLLWARFDGPLAFWMTLATMLCGYGSGVARNLRQGTIHRSFIVQYLPLTIPAAIIGGYLSPFIDVSWLILLFGVCVFAYGARMLAQSQGLLATPPAAPEGLPWGIGVSGGVLYGLITVGLGELMLPRMLADRKLSRPAEAVGSAVLIIFVTSVAAALVRLNRPFVNA